MTGRCLIEVHIGSGGIGVIVPTMDLDRMDWWEYMQPLAELIAEAHPNAEWTFTPIPDEWSDKRAISGH